jgi:hypothetical protein
MKKIIRKKLLCTSTMAPARFFFDRWNTWSNMSQYPSKREKSCCLHEWNKKLKWNATQVFNFFFWILIHVYELFKWSSGFFN